MSGPVGITSTLRVRLCPADASQPGGIVGPARILSLLSDVASELMIRMDGDEGAARGFEQVQMLVPVYVGDYLEATGVVTKVGGTNRQIAFEVRRAITYVRTGSAALSAANALVSPTLVCRALGTWVVPRAQQRHPKLVLPAASGGSDLNAAPLPQGRVIITPSPRVVITPPRETPPDVIIGASIVGADVRREHTPHIPVLPEEVAAEAKRCRDAGAAVVYLGVGDSGLSADELQERVRALVTAIERQTDAVIVVSGLAPGQSDSDRQTCVAQPGVAIVALPGGSFNYGERVVQAPRKVMRESAARLREAGIPTMFECYELGHMDEAAYLCRQQQPRPVLRVQFVLGVPGALGASDDVVGLLASRASRHKAVWFAAGVGRHQRAVTEAVLRAGGHVRVGLADSIYLRRGVLAESGAAFVERAVEYARSVGREPCDAATARRLLQLDGTIPADTGVAGAGLEGVNEDPVSGQSEGVNGG